VTDQTARSVFSKKILMTSSNRSLFALGENTRKRRKVGEKMKGAPNITRPTSLYSMFIWMLLGNLFKIAAEF